MSKSSQRRQSAAFRARPRLAKDITLKILAIRHMASGAIETVAGEADLKQGASLMDKNRLLAHICLTRWGHQPPFGAIAQYLIQTNSYQMISRFQRWAAFEIHFWEKDKDQPHTYSCRDILGIGSIADFQHRLDDLAQTLKQDANMDVCYNPQAV